MTNQEIAQVILQQLGGTGRLNAMTGATNFAVRGKGVQFKVHGKHPTKGTVSHIAITLDEGKDLYHIDYFRIRAGEITEVATSKDLYADILKSDIEQNTQLYLSL